MPGNTTDVDIPGVPGNTTDVDIPGMARERIVASVADMQALADATARDVAVGEVLLLTGEIGSGKTTFVQALARALGVRGRVTSPSFTIVSEYAVVHHPTIRTLVHVDLYRLEPERVRTDPAIRDVLGRRAERGRLTVIEWADRLTDPPPGQHLHFQHGRTLMERIVVQST